MMATMHDSENYLTIGEVADRLAISAPTLRYWEERGLLQPATRQSGRRLYGATELRRIALIRIWQESGMLSLDEIATVLAGRTEAGHWRDTVHGRLTAIDEQIERLARARAYLVHYLDCPRDHPAEHCPVVRREVEAYLNA